MFSSASEFGTQSDRSCSDAANSAHVDTQKATRVRLHNSRLRNSSTCHYDAYCQLTFALCAVVCSLNVNFEYQFISVMGQGYGTMLPTDCSNAPPVMSKQYFNCSHTISLNTIVAALCVVATEFAEAPPIVGRRCDFLRENRQT